MRSFVSSTSGATKDFSTRWPALPKPANPSLSTHLREWEVLQRHEHVFRDARSAVPSEETKIKLQRLQARAVEAYGGADIQGHGLTL